jgi:DNA-directed RNA polymerase subunit RPC12/RpoP
MKKVVTECYKCAVELEAYEGDVHPLCKDCSQKVLDWLNDELDKQDGR